MHQLEGPRHTNPSMRLKSFQMYTSPLSCYASLGSSYNLCFCKYPFQSLVFLPFFTAILLVDNWPGSAVCCWLCAPPSLPPPPPPLPSSEQGLSFMSVGRPNIGEQRLGQQRTCLYFIAVLLSSLYYTCYSLPTQPAALTDAHIFVPPTQKPPQGWNIFLPFDNVSLHLSNPPGKTEPMRNVLLNQSVTHIRTNIRTNIPTNIATGKMSPAITPYHFLGNFNFSNFHHKITFITR